MKQKQLWFIVEEILLNFLSLNLVLSFNLATNRLFITFLIFLDFDFIIDKWK